MSQITIPSTRRPGVSVPQQQQHQKQRNITKNAAPVEIAESNKRIRLELQTVHNIVGQVYIELTSEATE